MDLLKQLYVLPHWDRSCRSNFPSHPVTAYWCWANQYQHWVIDPIMPGAWQGIHRSANFEVTGMTQPAKIPAQTGFEPRGSSTLKADTLTTRPLRGCQVCKTWCATKSSVYKLLIFFCWETDVSNTDALPAGKTGHQWRSMEKCCVRLTSWSYQEEKV